MNTISETASPWRPSIELAVVPKTRRPDATGSGNNDAQDGFNVFGEDGFTFSDFIDVINPLQHIPIIATLYREMTGDDLDPGSRVIGDTLFLGPVGTISALANVMVDDATGKDVGEHVMALLGDDASYPPEVSDNATGAVAIFPPTGNAPQSTDPVTAWAMAEANFRNAAAQKSTAVPVADKIASYQAKATELASASALSESVDVANWAMGEALYRKSAAASRPAKHPDTTMPPAPQPKQATPFAEAPSQTPTRGNGALAALRRDLKAGAMLQAAQSAAWKSHQSAAMLAAANVDQTRQPATTQTPPGAIAAKGGWFSNTMTSALSKYDNGAVLAGAAAADTAAANNAPKTSGIDLSR